MTSESLFTTLMRETNKRRAALPVPATVFTAQPAVRPPTQAGNEVARATPLSTRNAFFKSIQFDRLSEAQQADATRLVARIERMGPGSLEVLAPQILANVEAKKKLRHAIFVNRLAGAGMTVAEAERGANRLMAATAKQARTGSPNVRAGVVPGNEDKGSVRLAQATGPAPAPTPAFPQPGYSPPPIRKDVFNPILNSRNRAQLNDLAKSTLPVADRQRFFLREFFALEGGFNPDKGGGTAMGGVTDGALQDARKRVSGIKKTVAKNLTFEEYKKVVPAYLEFVTRKYGGPAVLERLDR